MKDSSRRNRRVAVRVAVLLAAAGLFPSLAHAYLDPGTGSYILQIVIGALLGGLFAVGIFWRRVVAFLRKLFSRGGGRDAGAGS